jgi:hypothetical protein
MCEWLSLHDCVCTVHGFNIYALKRTCLHVCVCVGKFFLSALRREHSWDGYVRYTKFLLSFFFLFHVCVSACTRFSVCGGEAVDSLSEMYLSNYNGINGSIY